MPEPTTRHEPIAIPERNPDLIVGFGTYKGRRVDELPAKYLLWLGQKLTRGVTNALIRAAAAEYVWRVKQENERRVAAGLQPMPAPPDEIVRER